MPAPNSRDPSQTVVTEGDKPDDSPPQSTFTRVTNLLVGLAFFGSLLLGYYDAGGDSLTLTFFTMMVYTLGIGGIVKAIAAVLPEMPSEQPLPEVLRDPSPAEKQDPAKQEPVLATVLAYIGAGVQIALWVVVLHEVYWLANIYALNANRWTAAYVEHAKPGDLDFQPWKTELLRKKSRPVSIAARPFTWQITADVADLNRAHREFLDHATKQPPPVSPIEAPESAEGRALSAIWHDEKGAPRELTAPLMNQFGASLKKMSEEKIAECQSRGWFLPWFSPGALLFDEPKPED